MKRLVLSTVWLVGFVLVAGLFTPCRAGIDTGLSVYLPFGGTLRDQSGNGRDGEIHGATPVQGRNGTAGGAYAFDGDNDWLEISDLECLLNYDRDWSINFWIYLDGTGRHDVFFAGADGGVGSKQFVISPGYVKMSHKADSDSDWRVNYKEIGHEAWHMYTVTWSKSGQLRVYVDGVLQGEDLIGELADFCPENTPVIGAVNFSSKTQFFKGRIGVLRIYDRVLDSFDMDLLISPVSK